MKHQKAQQIGVERIHRLFELAGEEFAHRPDRSRRYVSLALEISKRCRARVPDGLKTKFCKKCKAFLKEGKNSSLERQGSLTVVKCLECGFARKTGRKNKV